MNLLHNVSNDTSMLHATETRESWRENTKQNMGCDSTVCCTHILPIQLTRTTNMGKNNHFAKYLTISPPKMISHEINTIEKEKRLGVILTHEI